MGTLESILTVSGTFLDMAGRLAPRRRKVWPPTSGPWCPGLGQAALRAFQAHAGGSWGSRGRVRGECPETVWTCLEKIWSGWAPTSTGESGQPSFEMDAREM